MTTPPSDAALIARYDGRVPRYTSYPTAPHFSTAIGADTYRQWLARLPPEAEISLYLHVPFCERLCLYCGCNTAVLREEAPRRAYSRRLAEEIDMAAAAIGRRAAVTQIHWGGGTPTTLPQDCLVGITEHIRKRFDVAPDAEIAIEIDPVSLPGSALAAMLRMGVTRASLGVQDFDAQVQQAIGRPQSFGQTRQAAEALRALGAGSINLDLIYGLPYQTEESVIRTARQALALRPERIAVFGYAHVPWMKKHQRLIREETLPGPAARLAQAEAIRRVLEGEGGYEPIGLDHFALPGDSLAKAARAGVLQRGFQGYSTDAAPALIGIGASAVGVLPQGYVQNEPGAAAYKAAIAAGGFATARGVALTEDDRLRRGVINAIMCGLEAEVPPALRCAAAALEGFAADGLVAWDGEHLEVTRRGRPFIRNIAAVFDAYLHAPAGPPRHAAAI